MSQHTAPRVILLFSSTLVLLMQRRLHVVFDGRVIPGRLAQACIMYFVVARPSSVHDVHSCTTYKQRRHENPGYGAADQQREIGSSQAGRRIRQSLLSTFPSLCADTIINTNTPFEKKTWGKRVNIFHFSRLKTRQDSCSYCTYPSP